MIEFGCVEFKGNTVVINNSLFGKGGLKEIHKPEKTKMVRLFIDAIRELYQNINHADHYKMGLLLQMIPYINPHFNCLCRNPHETNANRVKSMTLGEFGKILGYSERQCRRLGNEILGTRFGSNKERIAVAIALDSMSPRDMVVIVNSKLFFRGAKTERV